MKKIFFLLVSSLSLQLYAQKADTYLKLTDAAGQLVKGDATAKGYEKNIIVLSFSSSGKNNSQLTFTMNIIGASADLKKAMGNGNLLQSGVLTVTQAGASPMPAIAYTIKMENIKVRECSELMGCNNVITTTAVLTATRIGWTYYQTDASGKQTVARKYGYDNDRGAEWTGF